MLFCHFLNLYFPNLRIEFTCEVGLSLCSLYLAMQPMPKHEREASLDNLQTITQGMDFWLTLSETGCRGVRGGGEGAGRSEGQASKYEGVDSLHNMLNLDIAMTGLCYARPHQSQCMCDASRCISHLISWILENPTVHKLQHFAKNVCHNACDLILKQKQTPGVFCTSSVQLSVVLAEF